MMEWHETKQLIWGFGSSSGAIPCGNFIWGNGGVQGISSPEKKIGATKMDVFQVSSLF